MSDKLRIVHSQDLPPPRRPLLSVRMNVALGYIVATTISFAVYAFWAYLAWRWWQS